MQKPDHLAKSFIDNVDDITRLLTSIIPVSKADCADSLPLTRGVLVFTGKFELGCLLLFSI